MMMKICKDQVLNKGLIYLSKITEASVLPLVALINQWIITLAA